MGHVVRCIALAEMLKNSFKISFAIQNPDEQLIDAIHSVTSNIINLPETADFRKDVLNFIKYLDPVDGLQPKFYDLVLSRTAKQDIKTGTPLTWTLL